MWNSSRILTIPAVLGILGILGIAALAPGEVQATSSVEVRSPPNTLNLWRPGDPGQPLRISGWVRSSNDKTALFGRSDRGLQKRLTSYLGAVGDGDARCDEANSRRLHPAISTEFRSPPDRGRCRSAPTLRRRGGLDQ